ncbi:MAG: superoxide dismutase [Fe] [Deltaproteobacteria bacterium HGW-Deltaproteobacteria-14]|nr:MAG: superoxide dismutase [Fe] [Deltaproteobacteria bacterium HGW-Deltaproteobacteria-14]
MSFSLPALDYSKDALAPFMSAETFEYHYGKHHQGYISKLNASIEGTKYAAMSLEEIILNGEAKDFNNAAQTWNHNFFWKCLKPGGGGAPTGDLAAAITRDFGSFEAFKTKFAATTAGQFGSGWGWLVADHGKLKITSTSNADLPLKHGQTALFTVDVWEHAYYIDYRNDRAKFIGVILDNLANWDFAAANLKKAG